MQEPSKYDNPGFYDGFPDQRQDQGNPPPPPYYPQAPGPPPPGSYYPPAPGHPPPESYYPTAPGPPQPESYYPTAPGPPAPGPYYPTAPASGPYYPTAHGPPASAPYGQPYYPGAPVPQQPLICQQSTNVVVVNPQSVRIMPRHKDYMCWSIMNFLCCLWPLGLIAIIFSCKTRSDNDGNDESAARCSSKAALSLNIAALVLGVIMYIIIGVIMSQRY
ncbi:PREDICTED: leucine-rich repeat extensin-like protein 1 [Nanorana parkeri]|uniref:leucine-rich repeat extensin-like protein 1 n=1 Tax=Nanorana parkeri TaxID=125878 RepID=UPI0008544155|nr:PREDICTED: leucine-rich repeat extensin-like protein 1 [Nanorana parkeri]